MSELRFGCGDMAASIRLLDAAGNIVNLAQQSIAGNTLVLWFLRGAVAPLTVARLTELLPRFSAVEALVYPVAVGKEAAARSAMFEAAGLPLLIDPGDVVAAAFGDGSTEVVVIDAGARIAALASDIEPALELCENRFHADPPDIVDGGAPVLILDAILEPAFCRKLIERWNAGRKVDDVVATSGEQRADASIKRRRDVLVSDQETYAFFAERLRRRVFPEIRRAFQADMASFEVPRIGCYDSRDGGRFGPHRDNRTPYTAHRRFAMTMNLNTGEYEGGDLRFAEFGRRLYRAPAGGAVIFSCSLLHEAMPVTAGRRFGVFSFFTDAKGAEQERAMVAAQRAKGRSVPSRS